MAESLQEQKAELSSRKKNQWSDRSAQEMAPYLERAKELFVRRTENPILTPSDMPFPCKAVLNPGACLIYGEVLLLLRIIDDSDHSHLHVARSADGVGGWLIEKEALLTPYRDAEWYDNWGCEDARITYVAEREEYVITYVGWSRLGAGVCLATTKDFKSATRLGMVIHPYNKDATIFPHKINGKYQMLHRPTAGPLENIWISESDDLISWGNPRCVLEESDGPGWDSGKVGAGPPPIETSHGWFLIYHGVMQIGQDWEYRFGIAMLDLNEPSDVIGRWPEWVFGPKESYELRGNKPGIVFPTGLVIKDGTMFVYYGAADTCIGLATAEISMLQSLRDELEENARDGDVEII